MSSKQKINPGDKYGRLTAIECTGERPYGTTYIWLFECECGTRKKILASNVRAGKTKSCGCLGREVTIKALTKHGMTGTKTHKTWTHMRDRCLNKNNSMYHRYGGRGIKVCNRWMKFENFLEDMGKKPKGMQIDRIDNDGNYEPGNCRWVLPKENVRNSTLAKLNTEAVKVIKYMHKYCNVSPLKLANIYGVTRENIYYIIHGSTWGDIKID